MTSIYQKLCVSLLAAIFFIIIIIITISWVLESMF